VRVRGKLTNNREGRAMMKKMNEMILKGFVRLQCQKGQATTEYLLVIGSIVAVVVIAGSVFKEQIVELVKTVGNAINGKQ